MNGLPWSQVFEILRGPFDRQARIIIQHSATSLQTSVCGIITSTTHEWSREAVSVTQRSLWSRSTVELDLDNGAFEFKKAISNGLTGKHSAIEHLVRILDSNRQKLQDIQGALKEMKEIRWDYDDIEDENDDNYDGSSSSVTKLANADAEELQQVLRQSIVRAVQQIDTILSSKFEAEPCDFTDYKSTGPFVLRSLRELRYHVPRLLQLVDDSFSAGTLCAKMINTLHASLAESFTSKKEASFSEAVGKLMNLRYNVESLWAGSPPLPIQPSTGVFRYLRSTVKDMEAIGPDMWSVDALSRLKVAQQVVMMKVIEEQLAHVQNLLSSGKASLPMPVQDTKEKDDNGIVPQDRTTHATGDINIADEQSDHNNTDLPENILTVLGIPNGNNEAEESGIISNGTANPEPDEEVDTPATHSEDVEKPSSPASPPQSSTVRTVQVPTQLDSKLIQMYFDVLYLDSAFPLPSDEFGVNNANQSPLVSVAQKMKELVEIDEAADARIVKSVADYWRRIYLLFGLLVGN